MEVMCKHTYRWFTQLLPYSLDHPVPALGVALGKVLLARLDGLPDPAFEPTTLTIEGEDVDLTEFVEHLTHFVTKERLEGKEGPIALFRDEGFVPALRQWVEVDGNFDDMQSGEWLRTFFNGLVRPAAANSQAAERAVKAGSDSEVKGATRQGQDRVSTQVSQTHRNRDDGREAGAASAAASREAGVRRAQVKAKADAALAEAEVEVGVDAVGAPKFSKDWRLRAQERKVLTSSRRSLASQSKTKVRECLQQTRTYLTARPIGNLLSGWSVHTTSAPEAEGEARGES